MRSEKKGVFVSPQNKKNVWNRRRRRLCKFASIYTVHCLECIIMSRPLIISITQNIGGGPRNMGKKRGEDLSTSRVELRISGRNLVSSFFFLKKSLQGRFNSTYYIVKLWKEFSRVGEKEGTFKFCPIEFHICIPPSLSFSLSPFLLLVRSIGCNTTRRRRRRRMEKEESNTVNFKYGEKLGWPASR